MATLYSPRSTADFPQHALSLLVKLIGLDRSSQCEFNACKNYPSGCTKIPSLLNIHTDRSFQEPFLRRIIKSNDWIQKHQDLTIEVARTEIESDTYYVEGRYWRFHPEIEVEPLAKSLSERVNLVCIDPTRPATTQVNYLFQSDLLTIEIDRDRSADRNSRLDLLCEGDRYLLEFIYPHLFQAYQNSVFFTENQQLTENPRPQDRAFSVELAQTLGLTKRESEVLWSIAKDKSNSDIAISLECSLSTVKKHLEHIYEKLEVQTRTAAVMTALIRLGLITD
jgi:DNA-binding CsgD family transcriptional regulator